MDKYKWKPQHTPISISCATNEELTIALTNTKYTGYWRDMVQHEINKRIITKKSKHE